MSSRQAQALQHILRSILLGFALRATFAGVCRISAHGYLDEKAGRVVWPLAPDERIGRGRRIAWAGLGPLLQHPLGVAHIASQGAECVVPIALHKPPRRLQAAVEI